MGTQVLDNVESVSNNSNFISSVCLDLRLTDFHSGEYREIYTRTRQ
jgi:hypothetical protein